MCCSLVFVLARLKGFQKLTSIDEALEKFFKALQLKAPKTMIIPLESALNRVTAEDVVSEIDLPRHDRSAVDGYAVKAKETFEASQLRPRVFQIIDKDVAAKNRTRQVWTGNEIPPGFDAVVMLENIKRSGSRIETWNAVAPGENVSRRGEDVVKGEVVVQAGTRLKPQHIGLIAALGKTSVKTAKKPKTAILATGNELAELGSKLSRNQVFEVNRLTLSGLCYDLGAEPFSLGIAKDEVDEIKGKLENGLEMADVVLTSGGTSVGALDLVPDAVNAIGKPGIIVHGVAMRPGMPTALAVVRGKPVVVLPGNPVAAMIGFEVFVKPLIGRMLGSKKLDSASPVQATMVQGVATALGRRNFVRVRVSRRNGEFFAEAVSARGSSMLSTMTKANGFVVVPENREGLERGEKVFVQMFGCID